MPFGSLLAKGNTAELYLLNGNVVKVYYPQFPEGAAEYEANKQKIAASCGLSVPKILDVTQVDGRQALVMEYVQGPTLGELMRRDTRQAGYYLSLMADVQIALHAKTAKGLEPMKDKLQQQILAATALEQPLQAALLERLALLPDGGRLCHGDFHSFNLIQTDERIVILDWIDSSLGNPCSDVYRSYLLQSQFSSELADDYLRLFCEKSGISQDDVLVWAPIVAAARLSESLPPDSQRRLLQTVRAYF